MDGTKFALEKLRELNLLPDYAVVAEPTSETKFGDMLKNRAQRLYKWHFGVKWYARTRRLSAKMYKSSPPFSASFCKFLPDMI